MRGPRGANISRQAGGAHGIPRCAPGLPPSSPSGQAIQIRPTEVPDRVAQLAHKLALRREHVPHRAKVVEAPLGIPDTVAKFRPHAGVVARSIDRVPAAAFNMDAQLVGRHARLVRFTASSGPSDKPGYRRRGFMICDTRSQSMRTLGCRCRGSRNCSATQVR